VGAWQCVASCFLLDATENMLSTLETIHRILEMGGIWVNIGPLLYHHGDRQMGVNFANAERVRQSAEAEFKRYGYSAEPLVELTAEELKLILPSFGFEVLEWRTGLPTVYNMHKDSMQTTSYNALFFAVKKVPIPTPTPASESTLPSTEFTAHSN
jgi:carnosine N-methyltransferase